MQRLRGYVYQANPAGGLAEAFPKGTLRSDLPDWVVVDDGAFEGFSDGEVVKVSVSVHADTATSKAELERPAGNASREAWVEYAASLGLDVGDRDSRTDIISVVDSL